MKYDIAYVVILKNHILFIDIDNSIMLYNKNK